MCTQLYISYLPLLNLLRNIFPFICSILFIVSIASIFFTYKFFTTKDEARIINKKRMVTSLILALILVPLCLGIGYFSFICIPEIID